MRHNVVRKLRVINDIKDPKKKLLIDIKGKYFIINKHEKKKYLYNRNDIVYVWVTHNHDNFSYAKYTIDGIDILTKIKSIKDYTKEMIDDMIYGDEDQDFKHFLIDVKDNDKGIEKVIKDGGLFSFDIDLKDLQMIFCNYDDAGVKHLILVMNYVYKKFKNKENIIR